MRDGPVLIQQQDSGGSFDPAPPLTQEIMSIVQKTDKRIDSIRLPFPLEKEIDDQINRILNTSISSEDNSRPHGTLGPQRSDHRAKEESWFKDSISDFDHLGQSRDL